MTEAALLLVARPTPSGIDERSLDVLAAAVAAQVPGPVRVAHLDQADPSVAAALDDLADAAVAHVLVVPLAIPADRYLTTWTGRAVAHWQEAGGRHLDVRLADDLAALPAVAVAVAALAHTTGRPVAVSATGFRSPAWSELTVPDRHLLVCRGPRCTVYGAGATHRALTDATRGTATQVTPTGCLGPCNLGPLVVDHPTGTWHRQVAPDRVRALIEAGRARRGGVARPETAGRGGTHVLTGPEALTTADLAALSTAPLDLDEPRADLLAGRGPRTAFVADDLSRPCAPRSAAATIPTGAGTSG